MLEKITQEEIEFMECFHDPICMAESLFSDYDNLALFDVNKFAHIRLGQLPLLSYEYLLDEVPGLSSKENFKLRKGASDIYCFGGRLYGKTLFVEKVDLILSMILLENEKVGFSSYDALHIQGVLEEVFFAIENHPVTQIFEPKTKKNPYTVNLKTGYNLLGINMNVTGKKPGAQFFQKHFTRLYIEEASFETEEVFQKRRDSISERGCVFRFSGMTNFTKHSPCGKIFYNLKLKSWICNLPQYVNPNWDEKEKEKALEDFGGEQTIGYKVFIKGEVAEGGISVFDMERVRKCYNEKKRVKIFEINKDNFLNFDSYIFIERPSNADNCYIDMDVGDMGAPSEIIIIFEINKRYRWDYNISLYKLTDKEQFKVLKWIIEQVKANFVGIDTTDGTGRAIFRSCEEVFPKENLSYVHFAEKLVVAFEKDKDGNVKIEKGKPVKKEEFVIEWSVKHLQHLLYGERMNLPLDYKFDVQFNSVISTRSGNKILYACVAQSDHLYQAFQVFSISQWKNEFSLTRPIQTKTHCKSGV